MFATPWLRKANPDSWPFLALKLDVPPGPLSAKDLWVHLSDPSAVQVPLLKACPTPDSLATCGNNKYVYFFFFSSQNWIPGFGIMRFAQFAIMASNPKAIQIMLLIFKLKWSFTMKACKGYPNVCSHWQLRPVTVILFRTGSVYCVPVAFINPC